MILDDFNGHHKKWDGRDMNPRSKILEDVLSDESLCILNDDSITDLHPASESASSIALSLCDPDIIDRYIFIV